MKKGSLPQLTKEQIITMIINSKCEEDTFNAGFEFSKKIKSGDVILVEGELGSGKSVFIRGVAKGLGVNDPMSSPTFTIVNEYTARFKIYHFDLYRITNPLELYEIGFEEYIYSDAVSLIEWPSKAGDLIPDNAIKVNIKLNNDIREIEIICQTL